MDTHAHTAPFTDKESEAQGGHGVDSSSVVLGLGRLDHLAGVVTLTRNDLNKPRSVSSMGASYPGAGPVRVWTGGSGTPPQPPHTLSADPLPKGSRALAFQGTSGNTLPTAATKNGSVTQPPQNLSSLLDQGSQQV